MLLLYGNFLLPKLCFALRLCDLGIHGSCLDRFFLFLLLDLISSVRLRFFRVGVLLKLRLTDLQLIIFLRDLCLRKYAGIVGRFVRFCLGDSDIAVCLGFCDRGVLLDL